MITNQNIVITGASSGIGKSILEMLAAPENHNRVIAASRSIGKLTGFGENVTLFPCDLSAQEGVDALFAKATEMFEKSRAACSTLLPLRNLFYVQEESFPE